MQRETGEGHESQAIRRNVPAAVPFFAEEKLDERSERTRVLRGRIPPLLPAQPDGHQLGQHALGPRRKQRPCALDGTADCVGAGRARDLLLGQRGGRLE